MVLHIVCMTIQEKLNQLYLAARSANLNADQHNAVAHYAKEIMEALQPAQDPEEPQEPSLE